MNEPLWRAACDLYARANALCSVADDLEGLADTLMGQAFDSQPVPVRRDPPPDVEPPCNPDVCRAPNGTPWRDVVTSYEEQVAGLRTRIGELEAQLVMARFPTTGKAEQ